MCRYKALALNQENRLVLPKCGTNGQSQHAAFASCTSVTLLPQQAKHVAVFITGFMAPSARSGCGTSCARSRHTLHACNHVGVCHPCWLADVRPKIQVQVNVIARACACVSIRCACASLMHVHVHLHASVHCPSLCNLWCPCRT